jgi:hypothetical protein
MLDSCTNNINTRATHMVKCQSHENMDYKRDIITVLYDNNIEPRDNQIQRLSRFKCKVTYEIWQKFNLPCHAKLLGQGTANIVVAVISPRNRLFKRTKFKH